MNKNDKFQVAEFEVSAQSISNKELENISGGNSEEGGPDTLVCPVCGEVFSSMFGSSLKWHIEHAHPFYRSPNNQFS